MDYEKKIRDYMNSSDIDTLYKSMLNNLFPELAESEDEKVRKTLIKFFEDWHKTKSHCWSVSIPKILAWLENIPYTIDHEKREGFHLGYKAGLEKQGEQKLTWSEGDEVLLSSIINSLLIFEDSGASKMKIDWLKHIRKRIKGE